MFREGSSFFKSGEKSATNTVVVQYLLSVDGISHLSNKSKRNDKVVNMCFRCFDFSPH